ncbi:MAG: hypothetical protein LC708_03630, partial [Actinobacteria bacterium]|nr:hypothetical protein [Actinomycetota bacterium]
MLLSLVNGVAAAAPSGQVFGWGDNSNGALGNGTTVAKQTTPVPATGLTDAVMIAGGEGFSVALKANGTV